jgi:hypothetical protein
MYLSPGPARPPRANGHRYRMARAAVLAASDTCWWCGHPGAAEADHVVPRSVDREQDVADPAGMAPIHGTTCPCPVCPPRDGKPRCCNQERSNRMIKPDHEVRRSQEW